MELKPYTPVERTRCAFYGFSLRGKLMTDSKGNQCALKTESYDPCQMEIAGNEVRWSSGCPFNTEENRKYIEENSEKVRVFPREFRPPKAKSWDGISLKIWMDYIDKIH